MAAESAQAGFTSLYEAWNSRPRGFDIGYSSGAAHGESDSSWNREHKAVSSKAKSVYAVKEQYSRDKSDTDLSLGLEKQQTGLESWRQWWRDDAVIIRKCRVSTLLGISFADR